MPIDSKLVARLALGVLAFHGLAWALGLPASVVIGAEADPDQATSLGELSLAGLALLGALPILLGRHEPPRAQPTPLTTRQLAAWTLAHLALVLLVGSFVTEWGPMLDDEDVYLLQGRLLLEGHVREPFTLLEPQVRQNLLLAFVSGEDGQVYWTGCYALLAGLLTAPGIALGFPNLLWVPLGAAVVWQGSRLSQRLLPSAPPHLVPMLLATSPALIGLSVTKHTSVLVTLWALLAARAFLARSSRGDLLLGVCVGLAVHSRPLDGALVGLIAGVALWRDRQHEDAPPLMRRSFNVALAGLPFLALLLAYNHAVTGSATTLPYGLLFDGRPVYGFGETAMGVHDPAAGARNTLLALGRLSTWGLALPLVPWALGACLRAANRGQTLASMLLLIALGHYLAYFPAPFGQHASTGISYGIWLLPVVALMVAHAVEQAPAWGPRAVALTLLMSLTVTPYALWKMHRQHEHDQAPVEAARTLAQQHGRVLILHHGFETHPSRSQRYTPPVIGSEDEAIVWWYDATLLPLRQQGLAAFPELPAYYVAWSDGPAHALVVERIR